MPTPTEKQVREAMDRVESAIRRGRKREALEELIMIDGNTPAAKAIELHKLCANFDYDFACGLSNLKYMSEDAHKRFKRIEDLAHQLRVMLVDGDDQDC